MLDIGFISMFNKANFLRGELMRLKRTLFFTSVIAATFAFVACGGGEEEPSATATSAPVATSPSGGTPVPTSATSATAVPTQSGQSGVALFDNAQLGKYELEGIKYGGTLKWPSRFANALDPKLNNSGIWPDVRADLEKLVGWTTVEGQEYLVLAPELAESWSASADLKTYTFKIRQGVKWHNVAPTNGREFTAQDALFNINRFREKDAVNYAAYLQIESAEAPDKYTVVLKLKEPTAFLLNDMFAALDYNVPPELVAEFNGTLTTRVVGTGPYIMKAFQFRQGSSHTRNPDYWRKDAKGNKLPYIDNIEVAFVVDDATRVAAFRAGQVDTPESVRFDDMVALSKGMQLRVFSNGQPFSGQGFTFRSTKAPWNDVRVRRAINMMLDKDRYGNLIEGEGRWIYSGPLPWAIVFPGEAATLDKLGPYAKFNPTEAKKLLVEAGFADGKVKSPTPLAAAQGNPYGPRTALFQGLWKEHGFEFDLLSMDFATYNPYYFTRSIPDIALTHHILSQPNLNWFAQNKFHPDAVQNTAWVNDAEVNKMLVEIKVTTDPAKQREFAKKLWDFDTLGSYTIWTPVAKGYQVWSPRTRNHVFRQGGTGFMQFHWLADAPRTTP